LAKQKKPWWARLWPQRKARAEPEKLAIGRVERAPTRLSSPGYPGPAVSPRGFRIGDIPLLRELAISDEDVSGAVRDLQVLGNPGFHILVRGPAAAQARDDLNAAIGQWFLGNVDTFVNNQIFELTVAGASSVEWYPDRQRRSVAGAAVIPAEEIRIELLSDGSLSYSQSAGQAGNIRLSPLTYRYIPAQTVGKSPIGIPLIVAAQSALERKQQMIKNLDRMLKILGLAGIVHAGVPLPRPEDVGASDESDPVYKEFVKTYMRQIADLLSEGEESGVLVTSAGVELDVKSPARELGFASTSWLDNEHRIWSAIRTFPFMRGRSESLSESWAKVAYPVILAEALNLQSIVKEQLEFGINLHLRLRGFNALAEVHFEAPQSPFRTQDAQARYFEAQADEINSRIFGEEYLAMRRAQIGLSQMGSSSPIQSGAKATPVYLAYSSKKISRTE
jgi:hypothetical protein